MMRFALGQDRRHQYVFGAGNGDAVEVTRAAAQPVRRLRFHIAVRLFNCGAQMFQRGHVQVDGPRADGAAAGHGNAGATGSRH